MSTFQGSAIWARGCSYTRRTPPLSGAVPSRSRDMPACSPRFVGPCQQKPVSVVQASVGPRHNVWRGRSLSWPHHPLAIGANAWPYDMSQATLSPWPRQRYTLPENGWVQTRLIWPFKRGVWVRSVRLFSTQLFYFRFCVFSSLIIISPYSYRVLLKLPF